MVKVYDNGLKLNIKKIDGLLSVTIGIMIKAGSTDENAQNNGISHFIEHMQFKGTKTRTAFDITDSIDRIGAQINAFTSKEMTCYYVKSTTEHIEKGMEVLSDLFFNSVFDKQEIEREKGVIVEEINMVEDTPEDICADLAIKAHYGAHPLGQTILGPIDNIKRFEKTDLKDYMKSMYTPDNTVISIAGNIDTDKACALVEKYFASNFKKAKKQDKKTSVFAGGNRQFLYRQKDIEQTHISLIFPSCPFASDINDQTLLLSTILGGGMSSRLFQTVREQMGLCYSIYSYQSGYTDSGVFSISAGVNPEKAKVALDAIYAEIDKLKKCGIGNDEFLRAKEQMKGSLILSQESTSGQMVLYGRFLLFAGEEFDFDRKIKQINAVKKEDIEDLSHKLLDKAGMAAGYVSRQEVLK